MPADHNARMLPDTAAALRAAGLRDTLHPNDAVAYLYAAADRETLEQSAEANREKYGHTVHGPYETPDGLVSVVDFRAQIEASGLVATDPADPDDTPLSPRPRTAPTGTAGVLRRVGLRDRIHPADAIALTYPSRYYFDAWTRADQATTGNATLGPFDVDGQVVGITDFRPQLAAKGCLVTDPAEPDHYLPDRSGPAVVTIDAAQVLDPVRCRTTHR